MRKSIKSVMAFALAATLAASTLAPAATASAASKVNVITKATYNSGSTVKYSYNKKGLITKSVSTKSSKDNDSDTSTTVTTTFKYNKKNKVSTKTAKTVEKVTSYETDKTTGLKLGAKKGTVTTTTTTVTNYTYDKKGLATQSVATTTTSMSGSITTTSKSRNYYGEELADGTFFGGYNYYNADGTQNAENTKANAWFYTGNVVYGSGDTTTTTTYTDNGNGSYKAVTVSTTSSTDSPVKVEENASYYKKSVVDGIVKMIPLTKGTDGTYKSADGSITSYWPDVTIVSSKSVSPDPEGSTSTSKKTITTTDTQSGKTVTTTKYSYDKKKRVSKAVSTTVSTSNNAKNTNTVKESNGKTYSNKSTKVTDNVSTNESASVSTTTYSYDKKGRAKKVVWSNDGKEDSKSTFSYKETSYDSEETSIAADGKTTVTKESRSTSAYPSVSTTIVKDGVSKNITTYNPYTETTKRTYSDGKTSERTKDYSYTSTGGYKVVETYVDEDGDKSIYTDYYFDSFSKAPSYGIKNASINVTKAGTPSESTSYSYSDGLTSVSSDEAKAKIEPLKAAFDAAVASYDDIDSTETAIATPSKDTTTYAYDKNGNVKSAKTSGTWTQTETVKNETYGNEIQEFDAYGKLRNKEIVVTHKNTSKDAMENTVKKGTKVLTKKLTVSKSTTDRSSSSKSSLSRALFTIKGKKSSTASLVKKQQWIIQNGNLNGQVGLD